MNLTNFSQSPTGRVIKVGDGKLAYSAFVPNPLPPPFTWNAELIRLMSQADRALGELAGLGRGLNNPHLLIGPFIRREAVLSSRIEGTQTELPHLYAYEAGQFMFPGLAPYPEQADVQEVLNYVRALEYGLERVQTLPISLRFLRELHEILLRDVRGGYAKPGEFRHTQNWIGKPGCTLNEATYVPPPPDELLNCLNAFEKYLHAEDDTPPLVRLAWIHYQFEAIYPFIDGNGRIGRLLISLLLVYWELLPLPLLYISAWFEKYRADYYHLLLAVSELGNWQDWLAFFLRGITSQSNDALQRLKKLQDLQTSWRTQVARKRASATLLQLIDLLFEKPILTTRQIAERLNVTYVTAQNMVKRLVSEQVLIVNQDQRYAKTFTAQAILEILYHSAS